MTLRRRWPLALLAITCLEAEPLRIVVLKIDGLPADTLNAALEARDAKTGRSRLPWIERVFIENGARVNRFFVRGISLSAPSWAALDTGRSAEIRGNAEFDRYTMRIYDYLNIFPFYWRSALQRRVDMPGVEVLDDLGIPLISDRFPERRKYTGFQLYQRGVRWKSLQSALKGRFSKSPRELLYEWTTGFEMQNAIGAQTERELLAAIADPSLDYMDYFSGEFDHTAHLTNDPAVQLEALRDIDALVGRVWNAIENSSSANRTALILVSDHGMNTQAGVYGQGFNLIDLLNSRTGGAHHVITNRHPLEQYKIRGLNPFVSEVTTASAESLYLKGRSDDYPTALMDLDGNERASVWLRNSAWNQLQILFQQIDRGKLSAALRAAAIHAALAIVDDRRAAWQARLADLRAELGALHRCSQALEAEAERGRTSLDQEARRKLAKLEDWRSAERAYGEYAAALDKVLALRPGALPREFEPLVHKRFLGDPNSIAQLRSYVAGLAPGGLVLEAGGALDVRKSFEFVDYPALLLRQRVRNQPQRQVGAQPVDFVAITIALNDEDGVWLYAGEDRQALALTRREASGARSLRYLPVAHLRETAGGLVQFDPAPWIEGLPLRYWEDPRLNVPAGQERAEWLAAWRQERDWFRAIADTAYSNGIIGVVSEMLRDPLPPSDGTDAELIRRFALRRRLATAPDFEVFASDHWNFNVRGFNPGGNHGSFLRASTHSALMFAGALIPRGLAIEEPYDSLSFAPTVLSLAGVAQDSNQWSGPRIAELFGGQP
jgi:hypothetical protein